MNKLENKNRRIDKYIQELIPRQNSPKSSYFNEGDGGEKWGQNSQSIQGKVITFKNIIFKTFLQQRHQRVKGKELGEEICNIYNSKD